jgi:hypothetical protein
VLHVARELVDAHRGYGLLELPARDGVGEGGLAGAALAQQAELAALPGLATLLQRLGAELRTIDLSFISVILDSNTRDLSYRRKDGRRENCNLCEKSIREC